MYKKYTFFAIVVCLSLCAVLIDYYSKTITDTKNNTADYYILKSENDILALYKGKTFIRNYDLNTSTLPLTDQDNLKSGIFLEDMSAVISTIEDFDVN